MRCHVRKPSFRVVSASALAFLLVAGVHAADAISGPSGGGRPAGQIAFISDRGGDRDIWVVGSDGADPTRVVPLGPLSATSQPIWSPDGTRIGFLNVNTDPTEADPDDDDTTRVWVADADGANLTQLTRFSSYVSTMAWSPDGRQIAFDEARDSTIELVNTDGTGHSVLTVDTSGSCCFSHPAWSPDGTRLTYVSSAGGRYEIWMINADGTGARKLTELPVDAPWSPSDRGPSWSPDGTRIAFVSFDTDRFDIRVMDADGRGFDARQLTKVPLDAFIGDLTWGPDGESIAYTVHLGDERDVWVVGADGAEAVNLTDDGQSGSPAWSSDGTRLAFESTRSGNSDVWVMDADGADQTQLTDAPGFDGAPAWRPVTPSEPPTDPTDPTTPPTDPTDPTTPPTDPTDPTDPTTPPTPPTTPPTEPEGPDDGPSEEPRDRGDRGPSRNRDRFDSWGSWEPRYTGRYTDYSYLTPMRGRYSYSYSYSYSFGF